VSGRGEMDDGPDRAGARPLVSACALLRTRSGLIVVKPRDEPGWDLPGGFVQAGESPRAACGREVHEEIGLVVPIGRLLGIDWAPLPEGVDKLIFLFDGGLLTQTELSEITLDESELVAWRAVPPTELDALLGSRVLPRALAGLQYLNTGVGDAYLERGRPGLLFHRT
jgi:8-oxo-dGTP diphosphatase